MTRSRFSNIRSCRRYVESLHLQPFASAYELCDQLSSVRGRPIRVVEWPLPLPGPLGVWMSRDHDDIIVVQELATGSHREHILLHEVAHIVCGHTGEPLPEQEPVLPALDPVGAGDAPVLFRSAYDTVSEREAELLAAAFAEQLTDSRSDPHIACNVHTYFAGN